MVLAEQGAPRAEIVCTVCRWSQLAPIGTTPRELKPGVVMVDAHALDDLRAALAIETAFAREDDAW